jgi:hypothetical protein
VDQDFDIRRVQTTAEKFIPVYRPRGRPPPQQSQRKVSRLAFYNISGCIEYEKEHQ